MNSFSKYKSLFFILFLFAYAVLGAFISKYAVNTLSERQFTVYGTKARDLALLTASSFKISDAEVEELKDMEFTEVIKHPANVRFNELFSNELWNTDIRFAYIMVELEGEEVKYKVTDDYADFYETKVGTPLEAVWLVDAVVGDTYEEIMADDPEYYDDIRRYSYFRPEDTEAYRERKAVYQMTVDEYGSMISGFVPFYSEEGTFVGMLGLDIYIDSYESEIHQIKQILILTFFTPTVGLTAAYIFLYVRSRRYMFSAVYTDSLMSIKNRKYIDKFVPKIVKEHYIKEQPMSVIMIDVDFFKLYNDTYGHQMGDKALIAVAGAVNSALRKRGDYLCRYGGEELLAILPNTDTKGAQIVATRIKESVMAVELEHKASKAADIVTVSQGVYSAVPATSGAGAEFIGKADECLYEAKHDGRNQFKFKAD